MFFDSERNQYIATLVGYIPGSLYFEGKEVPYFTNKFADCAIINRTKLENYLKRKVV